MMRVLLIATLCTTNVKYLHAQEARSSEELEDLRSVPVRIVLAERLPYPEATAVIIRRVDEEPHDLVALKRSDASAHQLTTAFWTLQQLHFRLGSIPDEPGVFRVDNNKAPDGWHGGPASHAPIYQRLVTSPIEEIQGFGKVRTTDTRVRRYFGPGEAIPPPNWN